MKKFHVEIKENETGKTIINTDTDAIIGALNEGDGTRSLGLTSCNFVRLLAVIIGCKKAIAQIEEDDPDLKMISEGFLKEHGFGGKSDKKTEKSKQRISKRRAVKDAKELIELLESLNNLKKSVEQDDECPFEEFKKHTVS